MARLAKLIELVTALTRHRTAPTSGGIEFAYEPRRDGDADPGEVVWSWVEFEEDATKGKDRPVVIVGYWGDDLCGVPLTTKARPSDPDRVLVGSGRQLDDAPRPASSTGTWPAPPERPLGVGPSRHLMCIIMRMAEEPKLRVNLTLPAELVRRARARRLNLSEAAAVGLAWELEEQDRSDALEEWLDEVVAEEGPFSPADQQRAQAWVHERFPELAGTQPVDAGQSGERGRRATS